MTAKKSTSVRSFKRTQFWLLRSAFRLLGPVAPELAVRWGLRLWCTPPRPRRRAATAVTPPGTRFLVPLPTPGPATVVAESWGDGPTVYLLHGWGGWRGQLTGLVAPLVAAGYRVVALDAPAHGESGPGRLGGRRTTLIEIKEALAAVVAVAGPAHAVIAHSGGAVVTALAVRDGLPTGRLVFLAPMADPMPHLPQFARAIGLQQHLTPRLAARLADLVGRPLTDFNLPAWAATAPASPPLPPLLVVHDTRDKEISYPEGQALAGAWPGAVLQTTDGLGHRRLVADPGVIETTVEFVATGGAPGRLAEPAATGGAPAQAAGSNHRT